PSVAEFAGGNILRFVQVHTPGTPVQRINVWAVDPIQGSVHLTVADGRWPRGTKEIALGGRTMRTAHARIGDDVTIQAGGITTTMRVVGRVVIPEGGFGPGLGDGGAMSFQALKRFFPDAGMNAFPVRLNSGADK